MTETLIEPPPEPRPAPSPEPPRIAVSLVYSPAPRVLWRWAGTLVAGATLREALAASGIWAAHPHLLVEPALTGIWGRRCDARTVLRDGDRIELYRALQVDPKEARRLRYRRHRDTLRARA